VVASLVRPLSKTIDHVDMSAPGGSVRSMPTFLHKPARDGAAVTNLKAAKAPEDHHHDFKGGFWEDAVRCQKCKHKTPVRGSGCLVHPAGSGPPLRSAAGGEPR
jgi:hypothetical protein